MKRISSRSRSALVLALLLMLGISNSTQAFFWNDYKKDTLTYTPSGWPARLEGDLFLPKDKKKGPYPTMLLLHGGAWHKGDRKKVDHEEERKVYDWEVGGKISGAKTVGPDVQK